MRKPWRKLVIFLTVGALAATNCYGVPAAAAAHHAKSSAIMQAADHSAHDHASMTHHHDASAGSSQDLAHGGNKSSAKVQSETCCASMTCTGAGILASPEISPARVASKFVSVVLHDDLRTVPLGTIDPPPRTI
jgi:hypothetical protein